MTPRRAPEAVLVALAEAVQKRWPYSNEYVAQVVGTNLADALAAYRAAVAPLRTRAEVDAEIATVIRMAYGAGTVHVVSGWSNLTDQVERLCSEPTANETEPESIEERHHRMNTAGIRQMFDTIGKKWAKEREPNATTDHDADLAEPCGCEEAESLRDRLGRIRHLSVTYVPEFPLSALERIRKECG